jgi:hypothetical protein
VTVYIAAAEVAVLAIPFLKTHLDTTAAAMTPYQLPVLILGILVFALSLWWTYRLSAANFEKVDL